MATLDIPNESLTDTVRPLRPGDRLTRDEFERRYEQMPHCKKAELIEGVVYIPSPVSTENHGYQHALLVGWLFNFMTKTPGVQVADNATVRLDWDNEPQPDVFLRILPEHGGQTRNDGPYTAGGPEWAGEVAASSASYDLHDKKEAYRRNNVREYLVWRVEDRAIAWFILHGGRYDRLEPDANGVFRSDVFPGLWLDASALLLGRLAHVLEVLDQGLASPEHSEFVQRLQQANTAG